jgi:SAM-dependent methyltransferase
MSTSDPSYGRSAEIYDFLHEFKDFPATVATLQATLDDLAPDARSFLDIGCGTGRHLELLGDRYERVGTDLSPGMLEVARRRLPDVEFVESDMAELSLGRRFDIVACLFSSIAFVRTPERLDQTLQVFADHLEPGGLLLIEPWFTPEQYWEGHLAVNHATSEELDVTWMYVQERDGNLSRLNTHYLVGRRGADAGVEHFVEEHVGGLFTHDEYLGAFRKAGLDPVHDPVGLFGRGLYHAIAPA